MLAAEGNQWSSVNRSVLCSFWMVETRHAPACKCRRYQVVQVINRGVTCSFWMVENQTCTCMHFWFVCNSLTAQVGRPVSWALCICYTCTYTYMCVYSFIHAFIYLFYLFIYLLPFFWADIYPCWSGPLRSLPVA